MKNVKLNNVRNIRPAEPSPWLNHELSNDFRHEIQLAKENLPHPNYLPHPAYEWILNNGADQLLYKSLAKFAPLIPTYGFNKEVSLWTAPPLSGADNVICIVMGKDKSGKLRLVGGNSFSSPSIREVASISATAFFSQFDSLSSDSEKIHLVTDTFSKSISEVNSECVHQAESQCIRFYTMPIYLLVLDGGKRYFYVGPAVVEGMKQSDFSLECFEEVTL